MNLDLFSTAETSHNITIPDGDLHLYPQFFDMNESDRYFQHLLNIVEWKQEKIFLYGKRYDVPRLSAWYADVGKSYEYSGLRVNATPWIPALLEIKQKIETVLGERFNSVLVNQYRNGADGVAWHSDDEPELGRVSSKSLIP
ncbi:MAG: alpha-ketoglutarate-dependent dioxygenase AlkB [Gammaproteobacteria bacterium]|nr:alpha-ketoglutarate-dependent dioxygenase AlkB [Gammaproteobacteria bacterium]